MKMLFTLICLTSISCFAGNAYKINLSIENEGKIVGTPQLIVNEGQEGIIEMTSSDGLSNESLRVKVVASEKIAQEREGILLKFDISTSQKKGAISHKTVARPEVLVSNNKEAVIEMGEGSNAADFKMKLVAQRISL